MWRKTVRQAEMRLIGRKLQKAAQNSGNGPLEAFKRWKSNGDMRATTEAKLARSVRKWTRVPIYFRTLASESL